MNSPLRKVVSKGGVRLGIKNISQYSGRRFMMDRPSELSKKKPEKSLLHPNPKTGGRNVHGKITIRHRGGGAKRNYRVIDFRREKDGIPARVASIEYDPNRSARIALLHYEKKKKRYILAPSELKVGNVVTSGAVQKHQAWERTFVA